MIMSLLVIGCSADATVSESLPLTAVMAEPLVQDMVEKHYVSIGEVEPMKQIDLTVTGEVMAIYKSIGDKVSVSEALISLDSESLETSFNATESQLRTIRDNLKSQYDQSVRTYEDQLKLYEAGIITSSALDASKNQRDNLYRQYRDASVSYNNQTSNLKDSIDNQLVISPIEGVIADITVKEGESYNNRLGISIIDMSEFLITTHVSSDMKRLISVGDQVIIYPDGDKNMVYEGIIESFAELPDPQSKLFEVTIRATDDYDYILGEYVEVEYTLEKYEAYLVPTESLIRQGNQTFIYLYQDNQVFKTPVETGLTKNDLIEVRGLSETSLVITRGQQLISDKEEVKLIENDN